MEIVERAAYSWINRLLALRAMETRGLIDETLRTNPDYDSLPQRHSSSCARATRNVHPVRMGDVGQCLRMLV